LKLQNIFKKWETDNKPYLKSCSGREIAVAFSGGKDSSVCLLFLNKLKESYNFTLKAYLYTFPVHRYTDNFHKSLNDYWDRQRVEIDYHKADENDSILENSPNPCRVCQNVRKNQLFELFKLYRNRVKKLVLVSGHSLWDLAGYAVNRLVASELITESRLEEAAGEERFIEVAQRFYPFFTMPEGYSVYRPMLFLNQDEIEEVIKEERIPVLNVPCKYTNSRPKKVLGGYFSEFGYKFSYAKVMEFAKKRLNIPAISEFQKQSHREYLSKNF